VTRVLLHGFLGDPSVWDGIATPKDRALTLPGHGRGGVYPSWEKNVDLVAQKLAGAETAVGYSMGARVALGLLARGQIKRAILISGNPGLPRSERPARLYSDIGWSKRFMNEPLADVIDAWEAQPLFASQSRVAPERLAARRERRLAHDGKQLAKAMAMMSIGQMPDYRDVITGDNVVCIVGADDEKYVAIAQSLPGKTIVIPDAGHDVLLEAPDALRDALETIQWP
jgi:2-succinyl-6-hydroxy-2,4-cyclohexadiene-1-carboxylate synthase